MDNQRPDTDTILTTLARYVCDSQQTFSESTINIAYLDLLDSMACLCQAAEDPHCQSYLGPIVPQAQLSDQTGVPVPGTSHYLSPCEAAFNMGVLIRWLDFNDTWLAQEWGHPSDNIGGLASALYYRARFLNRPATIRDLLIAMIKAHEIQGVLALSNCFNAVGLDHVLLVRVATAAVTCQLLGGNHDTVCSALAQAWLDGGSLRTYRHAPNTGPRKSWAAGDATRRGLWLALMSLRTHETYPSALSAPRWGFEAVLNQKKAITLSQPLASYVMDHILFKVSYPAEFHAQTAIECAVKLHKHIKDRVDNIKEILIKTQRPALTIISKQGPLHNPADRDHCIEYMVVVALLYGTVTEAHYKPPISDDPRIDALREKVLISENQQFTKDYYDLNKRAIGNSVQVIFQNGDRTDEITVEYPLGHSQRREEALPKLEAKFKDSIMQRYAQRAYGDGQAKKIIETSLNPQKMLSMSIVDWMNTLTFA